MQGNFRVVMTQMGHADIVTDHTRTAFRLLLDRNRAMQ
jgi:hypothetical protein